MSELIIWGVLSKSFSQISYYKTSVRNENLGFGPPLTFTTVSQNLFRVIFRATRGRETIENQKPKTKEQQKWKKKNKWVPETLLIFKYTKS